MENFRLATKTDAPLLAGLREKVWKETYEGIYPQEMLDTFDRILHEKRFHSQITAPDTLVYIAEFDGTPIGYFSFGRPRKKEERPKDLALHSLYLLSSHQGKGIGKSIFHFIRKYGEDHQLTKLFSSCNAHNQSALAFYEKMGGKILFFDVGHENPAEDSIYLEFDIDIVL